MQSEFNFSFEIDGCSNWYLSSFSDIDDMPLIEEFATESWREIGGDFDIDVNMDVWRELHDKRSITTYFIEYENEKCGMLIYSVSKSLYTNKHRVDIISLFVKPEYRPFPLKEILGKIEREFAGYDIWFGVPTNSKLGIPLARYGYKAIETAYCKVN